MEKRSRLRRLGSAALVTALAMLLGGCLLWPGKFDATLDLRRNGTFTYTYDGEIYLLALSKLAQMGSMAAGDDAFTPDDCYGDDLETRDCTESELAQQRSDWDASAAERAEKKASEAQAARAMLGGIDPADPAVAEELAAKLRRQAGWKRVESRGDGLFDVSFTLAGRIDHDFLFPTIEGFPMINHFVALTRRADGTVRIDAPGFAPQASGNPFQGMMAGMGGIAPPSGEPDDARVKAFPRIDGRFTVTTDGEILANNTDEGPRPSAGGRTLEWLVSARSKSAPTALVRID